MSERFLPEGAHFYEARLVRDGPMVGVMTFFAPPYIDGELLDRHPRWQCLVGSDATGRAVLMGDDLPIEVEGIGLRNISKIDRGAYLHLVDHAAWAVAHARHMPDAAPRKKVDRRGRSVF